MFKNLYVIAVVLLVATACSTREKSSKRENRELKYVMDMVHNNPGEGRTKSIYNNPQFLKERQYKAMVPQWYINCAITYDNFEQDIVPEGSDERKWIEERAAFIDKELNKSEAAGIDVYAFSDIFVAPQSIWKKYGAQMGQQETNLHGYGGSVENVRKPNIQQNKVQELVRAQINGIFDRFPALDGLVIRFGETYLHDTPYHMGGKPVGEGEAGIRDHVKLINILRDEICVKRNKKLFYRTWDFGWFHTDPEIYLSITNQIDKHPNLIFSIKHTKGDFLRHFPFNPTLGIGKHHQIVEVQCQREYEGKGSHPNYIANAVINGFEEFKDAEGPKCLNDLLNNPNFAGVWSWSRGGGWKGPYITNELWCDLNAYVVSQWGLNTGRDEADIFNDYCQLLKLSDQDAKRFRKLALLSNRGVLLGHSSNIARINPWWIRDQFMGGITDDDFNGQTDEAWGKLNKDFNAIVKNKQTQAILKEKEEAVTIWREIETLSQNITTGDDSFRDYLKVSSSYGRIKYEIIEQAWTVMLKGMEGDISGDYDRQIIEQAIKHYHQLWVEFKNLKKENPQCATLYLPYSFMLGNEELHSEEGMDNSVKKYQKLLNL